MSKYDEAALRRTPFSEGYAVELADGQRYVFPAVTVKVWPEEKDDGTIEVNYRQVYADEFAPEVDIIFGVVEATGGEHLDALMRLAAKLLKSNYDLPRGAVGELLAYRVGDPASQERWGKVKKAILGRDPDASDEEEIDGDPKEPTANG